MENNQQEFFIGWQEKSPPTYAQTIKKYVGVVVFLVIVVASALVLSQRGFLNSNFELGQLSTVEGILTTDPVPMLKVYQGADQNGKLAYQSILLVGFGKKGAEATLAAIEAEQGQSLDGKTVQLEGTLIYYGGRTVMELTKGSQAFIAFSEKQLPYQPITTFLGEATLFGEILDPKCALGVMKPGYGKPHRSCAVLCVSGGIPPILRVKEENGEERHFLVLGPEGEAIQQQVLPYIADQLRLCGKIEQRDDWQVLYLDPNKDLLRLKPHFMKSELVMCAE